MESIVRGGGYDVIYESGSGFQIGDFGSAFMRDQAPLDRQVTTSSENGYYEDFVCEAVSRNPDSNWDSLKPKDGLKLEGLADSRTFQSLLSPGFSMSDQYPSDYGGARDFISHFYHQADHLGYSSGCFASCSTDFSFRNCAQPLPSSLFQPLDAIPQTFSTATGLPDSIFQSLQPSSIVETGVQGQIQGESTTWNRTSEVESVESRKKRRNDGKRSLNRGLKLEKHSPTSSSSSLLPPLPLFPLPSSSVLPSSSLPPSSPSSGSGSCHHHHPFALKWEQRQAANVRERKRMRTMNAAFDGLRSRIPLTTVAKKPTKVDILRLAIHYIRQLTNFIQNYDVINVQMTPEIRHDLEAAISSHAISETQIEEDLQSKS